MLAGKDYRTAFDMLELIYADDGPDSPAVVQGLERLTGVDSAFLTVIGRDDLHLIEPTPHVHGPHPRPGYDLSDQDRSELIAQHPGITAVRSGQVRHGELLALSDLMDARSLQRHPVLSTCYRNVGIVDQLLAFVEVGRGAGILLALNRSRRGFSTRDREAAALVLPHLAQAMRQHRNRRLAQARTRETVRRQDHLRDAAPGLTALTRREREVAEVLAQGLGNRQIARSLGITERTTHKHLENVYRKLAINSRAELLVLLHRAGPDEGGPGPALASA